MTDHLRSLLLFAVVLSAFAAVGATLVLLAIEDCCERRRRKR